MFITIEGPDGAGKSTQIQFLAEDLREKGYDVVITREPGGCRISELIRDLVLNAVYKEMDPVTETLLYAASRAQHVSEVIQPALAEGKIVICDRFVDSSLAYQAYGRDLGTELVWGINQFAVRSTMPDITFFFLIDPEKALNRKGEKEEMDRLEQAGSDFHKKVLNGYMELFRKDPDRIRLIDATESIEEIRENIKNRINRLLDLGK